MLPFAARTYDVCNACQRGENAHHVHKALRIPSPARGVSYLRRCLLCRYGLRAQLKKQALRYMRTHVRLFGAREKVRTAARRDSARLCHLQRSPYMMPAPATVRSATLLSRKRLPPTISARPAPAAMPSMLSPPPLPAPPPKRQRYHLCLLILLLLLLFSCCRRPDRDLVHEMSCSFTGEVTPPSAVYY